MRECLVSKSLFKANFTALEERSKPLTQHSDRGMTGSKLGRKGKYRYRECVELGRGEEDNDAAVNINIRD